MRARTQMQEGKGIFINNNINKANKNYPVGEKQTGWSRQGRAGHNVTRWLGSRQIDTRANDTQKTKTKAMCSHKSKTQAHGQQTNHQPCAKQDTNTQLMRKLISHVFTQDMTT